MIADQDGPVSLGGIMGGAGRGHAETTDVLLEVALFDPVRTAATGRRLAIESDARTRFERGLDPELVLPVTEFATRLIVELCGGRPGPAVVAGTSPRRHRRSVSGAPGWLAWPASSSRRRRSRPARRAGLLADGGPGGVAGHPANLAP